MKSRDLAGLVFEGGFTERDAFEVPLRGYRGHVWAQLTDGSRRPLNYYDVTRLSQELEDNRRQGRPFFAEPNLIILPEVTLENMETAAKVLAKEGYFDEVRSTSAEEGRRTARTAPRSTQA